MIVSRRLFQVAFCVVSGMLILPRAAHPQALNGSVVGNVKDASGAAVPGAAVDLISNTTNLSRTAVTDAQGGYDFATVQPGVYTVRVTKPGFAALQQGNVTVTAATITRADEVLTVGEVNQSVQVTAEAAALQTDSGEVRSELSTTELQNMPVYVGRNYQTLLSDLPGFTPVQNNHSVGSNPSRSLYFSANGGDTYENNIRVDGSELMNMWLTDIAALNPTLESIESVNVATGSFDADSGFAGGANVSVQTKSGTNEPHGALFEDYTGDALEARPFFLPSNQGKGKEVYNDFGAAMGYRIIKNKLFYFGSYEGDRIHDYSNLLQTIPDALQRAGDMAESGTPMYDPATGLASGAGRTPFPNNQIPVSRMDPIALKLQSMLPLPNVPGNPLTNNYNATGAYVFGNDHADGKLNWNPTSKLSTFARFSILDFSATDASVFGAVGGEDVNPQGGQPGNYHGTTYSLTTSATYVLAPNLILDGYFAWENDNTAVEPFQIGQNLGQTLGIPGTNGPERYQSGWPTFYVTDYGSGSSSQALFGTTASQTGGFPYYRYDSQRQYVANLSWTKGNHDLRFGTEIQQQYIDNLQSGNAQGTFTFGTGPTELNGGPAGNQFNAYSTFLLGLDTSAADSRVFDTPAAEPANQNWYSGYARDRWTISSKLTASLGVRWDYYGFPNAAVRGVASYDLATNQSEICGLGAVKPDCGTSMPKDLFSPRLGLAWRVTDSFVIRAGYGLDRDPFSMARSVLADYPTNISASYPAPNTYGYYGTLEQGLPGITLPTITNGYLPSPTTVAMTVLPQGTMPWTYSQNWNITAQKQLSGGFTAQVGYVANRTLQTISSDFGSTFNLNVDSQINTGTAGLPFYASEGRTAAVNYYASHGNVMYNSMQATLSRRMAHGFRFNAAWTWSKDEVPVFNVQPTVYQYLYLNTRALAGSDRTHTLVLNGTWELPFGRGKALLAGSKLGSAILGGWVLNALSDFYSGTPFSISTSGTSLNMTGATQLPIQVNPQVAMYGNVGTSGAYFNPLAFKAVTTATFGFVQPNNLRGPGEVDLDSGLTREFRVKERYTLQFRAEAFNFTNTPHFANPGGTVSNMTLNSDGTVKNLAGFAQVTAVANTGRDGIDQRQFQFSMHVRF